MNSFVVDGKFSNNYSYNFDVKVGTTIDWREKTKNKTGGGRKIANDVKKQVVKIRRKTEVA